MNDDEKRERYGEVAKSLDSILASTINPISRMATINCLLSEAFPHYYWTGFYLVDDNKPNNLVVGPYQGTLGCLNIPFGKGVCGVAAERGETQVVADVHALENHIACDVKSSSEIVVPVRDCDNNLIAVFDVDSTEINSFNDVDKQCLEAIINKTFASG